MGDAIVFGDPATYPLARETKRGRAVTMERLPRAGHPLRRVVEIDLGEPDWGMVLHLDCGHAVRLQRKARHFEKDRLRCPLCPKEERS